MRIRMLCSISGSDFSLSRLDETDRFAPDEAQRLIDAGLAVLLYDADPAAAPVSVPIVAEVAATEPAETATKKPAKEKRG